MHKIAVYGREISYHYIILSILILLYSIKKRKYFFNIGDDHDCCNQQNQLTLTFCWLDS